MGAGGIQVITTQDPALAALGLPPYPPLPATMDPAKVEEIRRTVYVGNLDSSATTEQLLKFFSQMGEVKYVRMAGGESQPTRFAFVEFSEQSSVGRALQFNGIEFCGRSLKINHSNNAIVKPQAKSSEAAHKEIEEAMRRVREAQSLITAAIEPEMEPFKEPLETPKPLQEPQQPTQEPLQQSQTLYQPTPEVSQTVEKQASLAEAQAAFFKQPAFVPLQTPFEIQVSQQKAATQGSGPASWGIPRKTPPQALALTSQIQAGLVTTDATTPPPSQGTTTKKKKAMNRHVTPAQPVLPPSGDMDLASD
ncbi:hypothetical protein MRX96_018299 [Rhipicephalus microplus]